MLYLVSNASQPVTFLAAGNLTNDDLFLHPRRVMDSYELISVTKGVLHIQSGSRDYHLSPGQFLLLFPGECHFGTEATEGELSFYWMHFYLPANHTSVCEEVQIDSFFHQESSSHYILPETGTLSASSRVGVLFVQLLDLAKRPGSLSSMQCSYAQSTLLLELTHESFFRHRLMQQDRKMPLGIIDLMEWLQLNYDTSLSVTDIAGKFGYHQALQRIYRHGIPEPPAHPGGQRPADLRPQALLKRNQRKGRHRGREIFHAALQALRGHHRHRLSGVFFPEKEEPDLNHPFISR